MNRRRIQSVLTNARRFEPETLYYVASTGTSLSLSDLLTLNEQIKLIKYNNGSVTLSGLVANFSNATGFQFVTNPSVDLRKWIGYYITFTSSTGNTLKVKVSAAGTGENKTTSYASDFSAGENTWTAVQGTVAGNIDSIGSEDNWLRFTVNTFNGEHYAKYAYSFVADRKYKLSFKYYVPSGQTAIAGIVTTIGGYTNDFGDASYLKTQDTVTTVTLTLTAIHTDVRIYPITSANFTVVNDAGGDDVFYIKDVVIENYTSPSVTGIYFTDPVVTGTFDYNAASYTAVITRD